MQTVSYGSYNDAVRVLQEKLKSLGYYYGAIDWSFGPQTYNAVIAFQRANGLAVDGSVGPQTWAVLTRLTEPAPAEVITAAPEPAPSMEFANGETGRWNGHIFVVSAELIRSFSDLQIKGSTNLDSGDDASNKGYATFKNSKPKEITFTVHFNAEVGSDVRKEVMEFIDDAGSGSTDYLYIGGKKLVEDKLLLVTATASKIVITQDGTWMSAQVALSFQQSEGGISGTSTSTTSTAGGGDSATGSAKTTVAQQSWVAQTGLSHFNTAKSMLSNAVSSGNSAIAKIKSTVSKVLAKTKAKTSTRGGGAKRFNAYK